MELLDMEVVEEVALVVVEDMVLEESMVVDMEVGVVKEVVLAMVL